MQAYSDPSREDDPYALPDIEVFYMDVRDFVEAEPHSWADMATRDINASPFNNLTDCSSLEGWYWWACSPGCLPDGEPSGPFATEAEALEDARDGLDD